MATTNDEEMVAGGILNLPVWARIVAVLGFPTVIACLLLAVFLGWVKSPLTEVMALQQQQIGLMTQNMALEAQNIRDNKQMVEYQNILLRTLCYNFAKNTLQCEPRLRDSGIGGGNR